MYVGVLEGPQGGRAGPRGPEGGRAKTPGGPGGPPGPPKLAGMASGSGHLAAILGKMAKPLFQAESDLYFEVLLLTGV
jgi:hypothetical protein